VFPNKLFRRYILPKFNHFRLIFTVSRATADACIQLELSTDKIVVINNGVDAAIALHKVTDDNFTAVKKKYNLDAEGQSVLVAMGRAVSVRDFHGLLKQFFLN
jgi:phosphatidylinositol alpha-1,6-mannosyltransferase